MNFTNTNLSFSDLSFTHVQSAIFTGAILTGTDLRNPDTFPIPFPIGDLQLRSAADITGLNLSGNDLRERRYTQARGVILALLE